MLDFSERDWRDNMNRMGWRPERIDAAFADLKEGETVVGLAADCVIIQDMFGRNERRFFHNPPVEPRICPTCKRVM